MLPPLVLVAFIIVTASGVNASKFVSGTLMIDQHLLHPDRWQVLGTWFSQVDE